MKTTPMPCIERLADHLEPWWRCVHPQPPMGVAMVIGECRRCEDERAEVARALAPVVDALVAEALREVRERVEALLNEPGYGIVTLKADIRAALAEEEGDGG